jgi:tetratricopeptide (TPR) repeat protein
MMRLAEAETAFKEAAGILRELAAQNPVAYRPDLAQTLSNLGAFYGETQRFAEAETAFKEAALIRRELAAQNPAAYRPELAQTLNNLASLYRAMNRDSDARATEAEEIGLRP